MTQSLQVESTKHYYIYIIYIRTHPLLSAGPAHLKLADELCKDAEEGLRVGRLAVLPEEGGHLAELLHGLSLQGLQRLDRRVAVLQEALWGQRGIKRLSLLTLMGGGSQHVGCNM